jgi:hypothetical protein
MTKVSQEQMSAAGLSEEEMAALEEEAIEETDDAQDAAANKTDGGSTPDDSGDGTVPQTPEAESKGAAADQSEKDASDTPPSDEPSGDAAASEDTEVKGAADVPPTVEDSFAAQLAGRGIPEDWANQLRATNDAIEELDKQLEDGDIDYAAHAKLNRELTAQLSELRAMQREAEFVAGNNEMIAEQHWQWEVDRFIDEHSEFKNAVHQGALRGALEDLYQVEENIGKPYRWFLREAAGQVRSAFGLDAPAIPANKGNDAQEADRQDAIDAQKKDKPQDPPPQTLGGVPEASAEPVARDEFSAIDRLEGMDLEAALAKMAPAQVDKYLNSRNY